MTAEAPPLHDALAACAEAAPVQAAEFAGHDAEAGQDFAEALAALV